MNKDGGTWTRSFQTNLPAGQYCDVINGDLINGQCSGAKFDVGGNGVVTVSVIGSGSTTPAVAFHIYSRVGGPTMPPVTYPTGNPHTKRTDATTRQTNQTPTPTQGGATKKTVVFLKKADLHFGENMFIRGGLDAGHTSGGLNFLSKFNYYRIRSKFLAKKKKRF